MSNNRIQNTEYRIQNSEYRIQNTEYSTRTHGYSFQDLIVWQEVSKLLEDYSGAILNSDS